MLKDFRKFIIRGNLAELAIGFTVGAAFSTFAKSLVADIIMPPVSLLLGVKDFSSQFWILKMGRTPPPYQSIEEASKAGAITMNYGMFLNNLLALVLVAAAMFFIIKFLNKLDDDVLQVGKKKNIKKSDPDSKKCPYCFQTIDFRATRCNFCTSKLPI